MQFIENKELVREPAIQTADGATTAHAIDDLDTGVCPAAAGDRW